VLWINTLSSYLLQMEVVYFSRMLVTTFSKVLEKVMYNTLSHDMQTSNIFVPEQFGFRKVYPLKTQPSN
jgi:hypothetical protein